MVALEEPTATPRGWVTHGDLVVGDKIFGPDGQVCKVLALNKIVTDAECYEIEFDDGFRIKVGAEHLWPVERRTRKRIPMAYNKSGPKRLYRETVLMQTQEIARHEHRTDRRLAIAVAAPLKLPRLDLPIDPYLLGCWLGDGTSASGDITCGDLQLWDEIEKTDSLGPDRTPDRNAQYRKVDCLQSRLKSNGLLRNKHIPQPYLRASVEQRLALLQGLMDTDGHCNTRGTATFVNINDRLVDGFCELCQTLALKPRRRKHVGRYKGEPYPYWQVSFQAYKAFPPFRLARKLERCKEGERPHPRRYIVACRKALSEPMRCIQVDRSDGLYLTGRAMIPTHNSTIITFAGVIQEIIRDPSITIGIFAHNRPTSKAFLRQVKEELEVNALLKKLFPAIFWEFPSKDAPKWSEDEGIIVRRPTNPKECTVEAWGLVDGMPTSKHYKLRVYDDVVTEKSVTTPEMIKKTTEMWELSDNLGARGGRIWMIGTRYHYGDTYGVVLSRGVIKERRHAATHNGSFDGHPVFLTEKEWQRKLSLQSKPTIAAQLLLNPLAGSETKFDIKWLNYWEVRPKRLNVYITVDASKGKHSTSDHTAISIIGIDVHRNKYLLDGWCHRMNLSRRWTVLKNAWKRWTRMRGIECVFVGYEQFGMQTDIEYFEERMRVEEIAFPIEEVKWPRTGPKSKAQRIERLEPDFRMGRLRLPHIANITKEGEIVPYDVAKTKAAQAAIAIGEPWRVASSLMKKDEDDRLYNLLTRFVEEYMFFPFAPFDDFLDAMSRIYDMDPVGPMSFMDGEMMDGVLAPEVFVDGI